MLKIFVLIFVMHIVAGFFLQTKKISKLKREKKRYLFMHVGIYTLFFAVFSPILLEISVVQGIAFSLLNGILHLTVDYVTGKYKVKFSDEQGTNYKLIVVTDYSLHLSMLFGTYWLLFHTSLVNWPIWAL